METQDQNVAKAIELLDEIAGLPRTDLLWWCIEAVKVTYRVGANIKVVSGVLARDCIQREKAAGWMEFVRSNQYIVPADCWLPQGPDLECPADVTCLDGNLHYLFTASNGGVFEGRPLWIQHGVLVFKEFSTERICWFPLASIAEVK